MWLICADGTKAPIWKGFLSNAGRFPGYLER